MQVTSLLSHEDPEVHPQENLEDAKSKLYISALGLILLFNAFLLDWFMVRQSLIAGGSAMLGALILGYPIMKIAYEDLRKGILGINELVALALLASFASGDYKTAGMVAFFMLVGEAIETRTAAGARASIESLIKLTPTKARLVVGAGEQEVAVKDLAVGDVIRVRPGDNVAADGLVISGQSAVNQASVTGESLPVDKKPGDEVFAGTQNQNGVMEIQVTRAGKDTTLGKVRELILAAEQSKLPFMRLMDQYMGFYTPMILGVSGLVWLFTHDLNRVISVLVVACPCAFILATPSAMVAAISAAARLGILIKKVSDLELAAKINAFVFDKTGTITKGTLAVSRLAPASGIKPAELLHLAASAERYSNHPTAKAVVGLAQTAGVPLQEPEGFSEAAGRGVKAVLNGTVVLVGRQAWLRDNGVSAAELQTADLQETEGFSLLFVARDGYCIGWIGLRDEIRAEAKEVMAQLLAAGVRRVAIVSGDRTPVAMRVAKEVGCAEVVAECLPQDKVAYVKKVQAKGYRVAVVGDGVNDAPALASGNLGIAMGAAGSEVAVHSATIALMNSDLRRLPFLIQLSKETRKVIYQNFVCGLFFIVGGLILATLGYLNPIVAAIMHNAGSLIVVFNSARLVRSGEELEPFIRPAAGEGLVKEPTASACKPCAAAG